MYVDDPTVTLWNTPVKSMLVGAWWMFAVCMLEFDMHVDDVVRLYACWSVVRAVP